MKTTQLDIIVVIAGNTETSKTVDGQYSDKQ